MRTSLLELRLTLWNRQRVLKSYTARLSKLCVHILAKNHHRWKMSRIRTYSELRRLDTFEDRFNYLSLRGTVGQATFGFDRWINQLFYRSREWNDIRNHVIARDGGCDLGCSGREIHAGLFVHHMNPITVRDISDRNEWVLDPEYLITTSHQTHNAIHYGDESLLPRGPIQRQPGDTRLW